MIGLIALFSGDGKWIRPNQDEIGFSLLVLVFAAILYFGYEHYWVTKIQEPSPRGRPPVNNCREERRGELPDFNRNESDEDSYEDSDALLGDESDDDSGNESDEQMHDGSYAALDNNHRKSHLYPHLDSLIYFIDQLSNPQVWSLSSARNQFNKSDLYELVYYSAYLGLPQLNDGDKNLLQSLNDDEWEYLSEALLKRYDEIQSELLDEAGSTTSLSF